MQNGAERFSRRWECVLRELFWVLSLLNRSNAPFSNLNSPLSYMYVH